MIRYIGFSLGSATGASVLAARTIHGGVDVLEGGYTTAAWTGVAICMFAAAVSWLLSRRIPPQPPAGAPGQRERDRLAAEESELATAGLIGGEPEL